MQFNIDWCWQEGISFPHKHRFMLLYTCVLPSGWLQGSLSAVFCKDQLDHNSGHRSMHYPTLCNKNNLINVSSHPSGAEMSVNLPFFIFSVISLTFSIFLSHFTFLWLIPSGKYSQLCQAFSLILFQLLAAHSSLPRIVPPSTVYAGNHLCCHFHTHLDTIHLSFPPTSS